MFSATHAWLVIRSERLSLSLSLPCSGVRAASSPCSPRARAPHPTFGWDGLWCRKEGYEHASPCGGLRAGKRCGISVCARFSIVKKGAFTAIPPTRSWMLCKISPWSAVW